MPITKRGGEKPHIRLESGFGSFGEQRTSFFGSGQVDKLDFSLGASYFTIDDFVDGAGVKHPNSALNYRAGSMANLGWNFNDYHRLGFSFQASKIDDGGREGGAAADGYPAPRFVDKDLTSFDLLYEGSAEAGDKSWLARYFSGNSAYSIDQLPTGVNQTVRAVGRYKSSESENEFQGGQAQLSLDFDRVGLTGGLDWTSYDFTQKQWSTPTAGPYLGRVHLTSTNDADYKNYGAFLLSKFYLLEDKNLILSGGLRSDRFDVSVDNRHYRNAAGSGMAVDSQIGGTAQEKDYKKILPSVGAAYNPFDFLKLRANYAQAYKVPTPRELAGGYYMSMATSPFLANPYLEPEESRTWELGFDFNRYNLGLSGTYFRTNYENYMVGLTQMPVAEYPYPGPKPSSGSVSWYENIPKATIDGMEWRIAYELGRELGWGAGLTPYLNWTRLFTYETGDKKTLPQIAADSLGFGAGLEYEPFGLTVNLDGTYYGARKIQSFARQTEPTRQGGATVWDMSAVKNLYSFGEERGDLKVKFAAKNIFDKYYDVSDEVFMPGSSYYVGLIYEFK